LGAEVSAWSKAGSLRAFATSSSALVLPSMYVNRFLSWLRDSRSLLRAPTLRAIAAGVKSSMLSKVREMFRLPSPVRVLGT
jgi:hypothetical protein